MFLGETKLLTLGFRKKGNKFVFARYIWSKRKYKKVLKIVAEIKLGRDGKVLAHKGIPTDCKGNPALFQVPKLK